MQSNQLLPGAPLPLGSTRTASGINFAFTVSSPGPVPTVELLLFDRSGEIVTTFELDRKKNRTGQVWHVLLAKVGQSEAYAFRLTRSATEGTRSSEPTVLLDPYATSLTGGATWGESSVRRCRLPNPERFDWEGDRPPHIPLCDTIIYELGVRESTASSTDSAPCDRGTYRGLIDKLSYLRDLGITAVELLPIFEFDETLIPNIDPETGAKLNNLWGYNTVAYFAPKASLAATGKEGLEVREFKEMVKAFHHAGIEIILDVVFNHTAEAGDDGPTLNFKGLANEIYYILDKDGGYLDFTGCGNTVNANHPLVCDFILDCLRYWVTEMHIDGFRFDLASALTRGGDGEPLDNPPLLERIAKDPVLAETKLIAEAWDAAGLYQIGTFPAHRRWCELNGKYRDDIRRFFRGDSGMVPPLATRVSGSSDLYHTSGRKPFHSVNFVTCHDGFTLNDLVSYEEKHNLRNGEGNRDGNNDNMSWNTGFEGKTENEGIRAFRLQRQKSILSVLFLSQGTPFLHAGDEFGRTKLGNNNTYCQDNETGWIDWKKLDENRDLHRFTRRLIGFRKRHPVLRRTEFLRGKPKSAEDPLPDIAWIGPDGTSSPWETELPTLAYFLHEDIESGRPETHDLLILTNGSEKTQAYRFSNDDAHPWRRAIDTSRPSPLDFADPGEEPAIAPQDSLEIGPQSVIVLIRDRASG